jgi:Flp pilus assembly protein TadG
MVEFALVAPVLLFLLVGLVDVGRYTYDGILAASAARAGVQYGTQNVSTAADVAGIKNAALQDALNMPNLSIANGIVVQHLCSVSGAAPVACVAGSSGTGTVYYVKVQVTGTFSSLVNYVGIPSTVPVSGSAIMRVANQ